MSDKYRIEKDLLGEMKIQEDLLYGNNISVDRIITTEALQDTENIFRSFLIKYEGD